MSKTQASTVVGTRLKSFIERIEKLIEERQAIQGDIKDVFSEAKGVGYDVKTMRKVIALRAMDAADRNEQETLLDVYWHALTQIDRVEARVAGGESIRKAAEAEGMPKSTAIRQVTQNRRNEGNGSVASPEPETSSEPTLTHERASSAENSTVLDGGVGADTHSAHASASDSEARAPQESCGGVEGSDNDPTQTRKAGNMPGSVPGEEMSSPPSRLAGATVPEAAKAPRVGVVPDPHDTHSETHHGAVPEETNHPLQDAPPAIPSLAQKMLGTFTRPEGGDSRPRLAAGEGGIRTHERPEPLDDEASAINHSATSADAPVASCPLDDSTRASTVGEARGEAPTNPDGLDIPPFLRRPRERVMA